MLSKITNDLVQNRRRLSITARLKLFWIIVKENDIIWAIMLFGYYATSGLTTTLFRGLQDRKLKHKLPGTSSLQVNKDIWENWDWSADGEEWTLSQEWKASLIQHVLQKYLPGNGHTLEIGPGAGRWTGNLIAHSNSLIAIDISEACVQVCRQKFGNQTNVEFLVGNGKDLNGVAGQSIDALWSFDVFVHINHCDVETYVADFQRVMKSGAIGVIHHGTNGGLSGGWRSDLTTLQLHTTLTRLGFVVLDHFSEWIDGTRTYPVSLYDDAVTVFQTRTLPRVIGTVDKGKE